MNTFVLVNWRKGQPAARARAVARLAGFLGDKYIRAEPSPTDSLPAFRHLDTGILLRVVLGTSYSMGLTHEDTDGLAEAAERGGVDPGVVEEFLERAETMRPVREITVRPFLLADRPLSNQAAANLLGEPAPKTWADNTRQLSLERVAEVVVALAKLGMRLPSEAEWELASRAARKVRFASGNDVPESPGIGANPWGMIDCGADAELCADIWSPTYEGAPIDGSARAGSKGPLVCRGGAARVWPWQDTGEWLMMLCAYRECSEDADEFLAVRPAMSLPAELIA